MRKKMSSKNPILEVIKLFFFYFFFHLLFLMYQFPDEWFMCQINNENLWVLCGEYAKEKKWHETKNCPKLESVHLTLCSQCFCTQLCGNRNCVTLTFQCQFNFLFRYQTKLASSVHFDLLCNFSPNTRAMNENSIFNYYWCFVIDFSSHQSIDGCLFYWFYLLNENH